MQEIRYIDRQRIIDINKKIIRLWNARHTDRLESVNVGTDRIDGVLQIVVSAGNDLPFENMIIEKAAYLVGGLAWAQAFSGGNKRTAVLSCSLFLSQNGHRLNIPDDENPQLRQLLYDIQEERSEINRQIIEKIILYITKHISVV
ncbi:Fic family protein [Candidatus Nitrosotenuis sp. DW1]|uniref:Fic family protein n=1 Tax=Candidatus Nitrosotenuis sp. DW1 TaxID=2259672 RepID=UPI0015CE2758|nr:Fic family protein [Candidatus Nitrosotenuis sp. DW1]QLH09432.1 hypothetical protein DSQ19_08060 [Candidatus Nitrosotenuis sp. DW1]